jgi:hypothetical protein
VETETADINAWLGPLETEKYADSIYWTVIINAIAFDVRRMRRVGIFYGVMPPFRGIHLP